MGSSRMIPPSPSKEGARLDEWVASHGPLWAPDALVIALDVCAGASHLTRSRLAAAVDSLNAACIIRQQPGGWVWVPAPVPSAARTIPDSEVVARVGAILFHALTGQVAAYRFDSERALRTTLRSIRPDLPANVVDLVARALTTSRSSNASLTSFARDLRQALGIDSRSATQPARRANGTLITAGAALTAILLFTWTYTLMGRDRLELHGLTSDETAAIDISSETAQTLSLIDEHTAAVQTYQQTAKSWSTRIGQDDPRLAWNQMHEAWVRTLAGDRLTAEQLLEKMPSELARWLGEGHPYAQAARLELADTLDARGARAEAAALRSQAEIATRALFDTASHASFEFDPAPVSPGVFAHVAPNIPVREGFRAAKGEGFFVPLTSAERWIAGRNGWRLHVVATGTCKVSLVAGADPRAIAADMVRSTDGRWKVHIEGSKPTATLDAGMSAALGVTVAGDGTGSLKVTLGPDTIRTLDIDPSGSSAFPPYSLTFSDASSCAVVWLEIPFPVQATFRRADKAPHQ